ncbi:MAG: hypothetical protein P1S60_01950, partial [Anaerolineae bacterium]|nr:hypothetical protein [Anaerolineae bacterium]
MNQKPRVKFIRILWTLSISSLVMVALFISLQNRSTVQASLSTVGDSAPVALAQPEALPSLTSVKAILSAQPDMVAHSLSGGARANSAELVPGSAAMHSTSLESLQLSPPVPGGANLVVSMDSDRVWGVLGTGQTVTVTVDGTQMGAAVADNNGFFWTTLYNTAGEKPDLDGGEVVQVYRDGSLQASTTLRVVTATIDVVNDDVTGRIAGASTISVTVYPGWAEPNLTTYSQTVSTDGSGVFTVDFTGNWDFIADDRAQVAYTENGIEVHQRAFAQRLRVSPYPANSALGNTVPGSAITVTVYESDGVSVRQQEFGSASGDEGGAWRFEGLDLNEGDIVHVEIE